MWNPIIFRLKLGILCALLSSSVSAGVLSLPNLTGTVNKADSQSVSRLNIIPYPVVLEQKGGIFQLKKDLVIQVLPSKSTWKIAEKLSKSLTEITAVNASVQGNPVSKRPDIILALLTEKNVGIGDEGYRLEITTNQIRISANKDAGLFYGAQTLLQIVADAVEKHGERDIRLPTLIIDDYPRFSYRGMLFDVAHHFLGMDCLKEFINQMAMFKYNRLQLHLTNDNGWRIEIKKYPKLTEIGAWRVPRTGAWRTYDHLPPMAGEPRTDGGFFSQDDIREILQYASERYIEIVPGIELPGHMLALIAAYPEVSCTEEQYQVNPGIYRRYGNGVHPSISHEMCAGKESNFTMLENILDEYIQLFPGKYIHIGGDEAYKGFWERCEKCKRRMQQENLKDVDELQSYIVKRVEKYLNSKGKELLGWDEILEGGLPPNSTVMSWRGVEGGVKAARMGHQVIMAPNTFAYFDHRQTDQAILPHVTRWHYLPLSRVYTFEPVQDNVDPKYILGGQACLWSEFIRTCDENSYQAWPRGMALSEVLWSSKKRRDIDDFYTRLEPRLAHFEKLKIRYSTAIYDPVVTPKINENGDLEITLSSEVKGLDIHYTFNDHIPTVFQEKYKHQPIHVPKGASRMLVTTYRNEKRTGGIMDIAIADLEKRAKSK